MASNAQKTPLTASLNAFAQRKAADAIQLLGKALPATVVLVEGPIVTVQFQTPAPPFTLPNVRVPIFGPEYIRYPLQNGCTGVVFPIDAYIGSISGLGEGTPGLSQPGNLSALVFFPIGNSKWATTEDVNALVLYGPDGVIIRDANKKSIITVTANGIVIHVQSGDAVSVQGNLDVTGNITAGGEVTRGQGTAGPVTLGQHIHPGNGLPPTPGH